MVLRERRAQADADERIDWMMLAVSALGIPSAVSLALAGVSSAGWCSFSLVSLTSALVGALLAFRSAHQSEQNAMFYRSTARDLDRLSGRLAGDEEAWSDWVDDVEDAISHERDLWLSSRLARGRRLPSPAPESTTSDTPATSS